MTRPTWDETWLALAQLMAARSRCPSGAGCAIIDQRQRVVATGYAGPPATYRIYAPDLEGSDCTGYCERQLVPYEDRDPAYADCPSSHAELNALMFADRSRVEGGTLYVSSSVCLTCVKPVGNSGVGRVVWPATAPVGSDRRPDLVLTYLVRCGVVVDVV